MRKSKRTKRSLTASIVTLVVCVAMLIGTTFAWFTDTASTSVNKIQAGTLDVVLQMSTDGGNTWTSAEGKTLDFIKSEAGKGEQILWEPGCTYELPMLRISNEGNLSLKYKLTISGITGSSKLAQALEWTFIVDNEEQSYSPATEYHLDAKNGDSIASNIITIKGHMPEILGNEYMGEEVTGISITVYAVQDTGEHDSYGNTYDANADGTPQFGTWQDNVSASTNVTAGEDTVIKDRETNPTITVNVPVNSTQATELTLIKTETDVPTNITVDTGTTATSAEISLVDQDGKKVTASNGQFFTVNVQFDAGLNVIDFYHYQTKLTKADSAEAVANKNDSYYYDKATGILTFSTDDFSPFTLVVSDSDFNGGDGKEDSPYLIATAEQALAMGNTKGAYKLVNDIVVSNEIYLSGKSYTLDLNGHSLSLKYAADVKPNSGGVLNISGKNGKLTIKDTSESQAGAVYGSSQSYNNKVTSAVRVGNYGKLDIYGGHYYGMSQATSCIYVHTSTVANGKATVIIYGGAFETASASNGTYYVLNHGDGTTNGCTITVRGGTFKNYNPGVTKVDASDKKTGKITLASGCTTKEEVNGSDIWYTVVNNN